MKTSVRTRSQKNAPSSAGKLMGEERVNCGEANIRLGNKSSLSRNPATKEERQYVSVKDKASSSVVALDNEPKNSELLKALESTTIKTFLRIRPMTKGDADASSSPPYLKFLSETTVEMLDSSKRNFLLRSDTDCKTVYTFSQVFSPDTSQANFFTTTTLPLVKDFLNGKNSLIFSYGVTNSGKTYTIEGGQQLNAIGLLPRTLNVIFCSLKNLNCVSSYHPADFNGAKTSNENAESFFLEDGLQSLPYESEDEVFEEHTISVDDKYGYSVWISYAEVYNDKIYDLLAYESLKEGSIHSASTKSHKSGESLNTNPLPALYPWQRLESVSPSGGSLIFRRKALSLKNDQAGIKYVSNLRHVRVRTALEAKAVFHAGKANRRVFGTLANSASSRSHTVFTIKIIKFSPDRTGDASLSQLSIIDLAGSERNKITQASGERLREAGSINKSLMVLGQCLETMRANQRRLASSSTVKLQALKSSEAGQPKASIVPFRHSKLTELFQGYFLGQLTGQIVMIVNVNPYDTGFDENMHVMKFAAIAKEVTTSASNITATPGKMQSERERTAHDRAARHREVVIYDNASHRTNLQIVEEDGDSEVEEDGASINPLVDALFDEVDSLRMQLYESELRCAIIEAEVREEVMKEVENTRISIEQNFRRRLMHELESNSKKTDAKLEMLQCFPE